ncbi:MAG: S-methyl-5-thioribose-1-phosphate isomerase [Calditrichaeota bacterium]|nr:MAG: S-methyl-5-thioribose-1-phosphate isomerase [Calditrichota bacterium]
MIHTIEWTGQSLRILDQTRLPEATVFQELKTVSEVFTAIRELKVRGAPLIGITAAYGLYLAMAGERFDSREQFFQRLEEQIRYLASARPTAVNLEWALRRIQKALQDAGLTDPNQLTERILALARHIHEEDRLRCERIAQNGQALIPERATILTHCNTGILATGGIGTALGIIYRAVEEGKKITVLADETRPLLQGARLTSWELFTHQIPVTLICDDMAGWAMRKKGVDLIVVGADRIAADGSTANKIGTYSLAVLARHHGIPFYVAAPLSTFDLSLAGGEAIPIEERSALEVKTILGRLPIAPDGVDCWNPAFDVTPPELITAIVTDAGIASPPFKESIAQLFQQSKTTKKLEGEPL